MSTSVIATSSGRRSALRFGLAATIAGLTTPAIAGAEFVKPPPLPWRNGPRLAGEILAIGGAA